MPVEGSGEGNAREGVLRHKGVGAPEIEEQSLALLHRLLDLVLCIGMRAGRIGDRPIPLYTHIYTELFTEMCTGLCTDLHIAMILPCIYTCVQPGNYAVCGHLHCF